MGIQQITTLSPGLVGVYPRLIYILTNDTIAQVTAAGYLNNYNIANPGSLRDGDMGLVVTKTDPNSATVDTGFLQVTFSSNNWSLTSISSPGEVVLPTIANHIATYTNTTGTLSEDPATAISGGNLQAGLSGTAGSLISFSSTAARGSLKLTAVANTGDTVTTISNAAMGQATTLSIIDPGGASANFILSASPSGQTMTGGLTLSTNSLAVSSGTITSGSSGNQGIFICYPATAANGTLLLQAANAGGAFNTTISNGTMTQSTVYTIPNVSASTGQFLAKTAALVSGNLVQASGTAGVCVDSGVATTAIQLKSQVKAVHVTGLGGAGSFITVPATGLTSSSIVCASVFTSTNTTGIFSVTPGTDNFVLVLTADPGAQLTINYIAYFVQQ